MMSDEDDFDEEDPSANGEENEGAELEGAALEQLLSEIPALINLKRFAFVVDKVDWFHAIGENLTEDVRRLSRDYLDGLGFPDADLAVVSSFEEASDAAETLDWDSAAWEVEEQLRAGLVVDAMQNLEEEGLQIALAHITSKTAEGLQDAMDNLAAIWDVEDETLITAATGAIVQTVYNAALLLAAGGEETHPFALKYRLYELGRWPIGVHGRSFNLF